MKNLINFFDAELIGNELWFSNLNFNALMKTDIRNGNTEIVSTFNDEDVLADDLHIKTIRYNDFLFFIPYSGNTIHVWNINNSCFENSIKLEQKSGNKWADAYMDNNNIIWMIPEDLSNSIVVVDAPKRTAQISDVMEHIRDFGDISSYTISTKCVDFQYNMLYIQIFRKNICFRIDCSLHTVKKYNFPDNVMATSFRAYNESTFYLYLYGNPNIFELDTIENNLKCHPINISVVNGTEPYWDTIRIGNKLLLIPCQSNDLILYDTQKQCQNKIELPETVKRCKPDALFGFYKLIDNIIYLFPKGCNELVAVNTTDYTTFSIRFILSEEDNVKAADTMNRIFEKHYASELNEAFAYTDTMNMFLEKLVATDSTNETCSESNIGYAIHRYIMDTIK